MIGSKGVEKSVIHANDTIEFWKLWKQLNNHDFNPRRIRGV